MEGIALVKISDLEQLFQSIQELKMEFKQMKEREEELKGYSIQQTADLLNLHYGTVRRLIIKGELNAKYLEGDRGKCIVPYKAISEYLSKRNR